MLTKKIFFAFFVVISSTPAWGIKQLKLSINTCMQAQNDSTKTVITHDPNTSARLEGCEEALANYYKQLDTLKMTPSRERNPFQLEMIIKDAISMQEIVTPTSPEMANRFALLISCAQQLF